jgi:GNAT superfamily N-acetyltransferase
LSAPEGYISELFVCKAGRKQGVGGMLLEKVKEIVVKRGCSRLMLVNSRKRESYKRSFYKKIGFEECPEMANFVLCL